MQCGDKFNFLTAIGFHHRDKKNCFWEFKCDCGKTYIARKAEIEKGSVKSCGCMKSKLLSQRNPVWSKPYGIAAKNQLLYTYKRNALAKGLVFELTDSVFFELTKQNCFYCGVEPRQRNANIKRNGTYAYNGVDRIDNLKGYVYDNCVSCCGICNIAKNDLSNEEFEDWLSRLLIFQSNKRIQNKKADTSIKSGPKEISLC